MTPQFLRGFVGKTILLVSLGSVGLVLVIAILAIIAQITTYGFPVKLLVTLSLVVALVLGSRSALRRRTGTVTKTQDSWVLAALAVAIVFLVANQLIVRGIAVGIWDADGELFPFQVLVSDFARSGGLIHWDPWSNGGLPSASDPSFGAFSPLNIAIGLVTGGSSAGFRAYWLLVWFLGGLGMLMLGRHLNAPAWGGAVIAIGFLFCGFYTGNASHTSCIVAFSFLPLIIWRLDHALVSRSLRPSVEAGGLWGLSALSGYPAQTILTGLFCVLWTAGRLAVSEDPKSIANPPSEIPMPPFPIRARIGLFVAALAVMFVSGLAVLSPTYHAFFAEAAGTTARSSPISRDLAVSSNALEPGAVSTLASPYLAALKARNQIQGDRTMWPATDLTMCSVYSGVAIVIFAILSIVAHPRDRWRLWLVLLAILNLGCAMGGVLPLRGWLYDWVYPMRFFRHPALFGSYFVFTISVIALTGTRALQRVMQERTDPIWRRFKIVSIVCAPIAFTVFLTVVRSAGAERPDSLRQSAVIWLVVSGAWLAIPGLTLLTIHWPDSISLRSFGAILVAIAAADALLTWAVSQSNMVSTDVADVVRWQTLDARHSESLDLTENGLMRQQSACVTSGVVEARPKGDPGSLFGCPFSDQLMTKIPVLESYSPLTNPFHIRIAANPLLREMALGEDRIWFSAEAVQVPVTEDLFTVFEQRAEALQAPPLLIHTPEALKGTDEVGNSPEKDNVAQIKELPACQRISVRLRKYDPDELDFDVDCPADGWLLVTDRWGPAWRAEVNGQVTQVFGGNFVFRAIQVRAGENTVAFSYHPPLFPWLLILSWTTLGGTAVSAAYAAARRIGNRRTSWLLRSPESSSGS